ncbi:hypothetical protein DFS33DRAFT_1275044 [Desarmillaria ectypa]|nr:hypothetical protein DFS33DRAFT_1275044 [Desarmillaria ectypa]
MLFPSVLSFGIFISQVWSLSYPSTFWPAGAPLAVRSPYLNSYLNLTTGANHANEWPQHWTEDHIVAWDLWISVDGEYLQLFGGGGGPATNLINVALTPTRTILVIQAGPMDVNVTFLSPIETDSLVRQSFPFTYLYVDAVSRDGRQHDVQFYTDVTGEWLSNDITDNIRWSTAQKPSFIYHEASLSSPSSMNEDGEMALDATLYYATPWSSTVTFRTGDAAVTRPMWTHNKTLSNTQDNNYRAINDNWPTFSFAFDAGNITTSPTLMWALGLVRNPSIKYRQQDRYSYFWTEYDNIDQGINAFLQDFEDAQNRADNLDESILSAARNISSDYGDLVTLAARQTLASTDITVSKAADGSWNSTDIKMFMKDIGSSRRVNPVDVMYASIPAFLHFNASWAGYLLEPLLDYQQSTLSQVLYAAPDLGEQYPIASGNTSPPVNESISTSADMLIMAWMYGTYSTDSAFLRQYYTLFRQWAEYLKNVTSASAGFVDSDGLDNVNLELKSIIGIACTGKIAGAIGQSGDADDYESLAQSYMSSWQSSASEGNHLVSTYGNASTWSLIYNMFPDRLLNLSLVEEDTYSSQDTFYLSQISDGNASPGIFGIQYDSTVDQVAKSHWTMLTAGATRNTDVRDGLVSAAHQKGSSNASAGVFPTTYNAQNGTTVGGRASPAQGAIFSLLALNLDPLKGASSSGGKEGSSSSTTATATGAIVGGVVVGVVTIAVVVVCIFFWRRRKQRGYHMAQPQAAELALDQSPENQYAPMASQIIPYGPASHFTPPLVSAWSSDSKLMRLMPPRQDVYSASTSGANSRSAISSEADTATQLRDEVENLRREMEQIRVQTAYQAPPEYELDPTSGSSSEGTPAQSIPGRQLH